MKAPAAQVLREAVRDIHRNETFEKALGRAVRTHHGTFEDHMELVAKVRAQAKRDGTGLVSAAEVLSREDG